MISINLALIAFLSFLLKKSGQLNRELFSGFSRNDNIALIILALITLPMFIFASLYPNGGWDAWGTWNTKAHFLFSGGTHWTNMFDHAAWRTQVLYPFLLPLINVWGWCFGHTTTYIVPLAMTCIIPFLTAGILYTGLKELTGKNMILLLAPAWIFTNMFTIELSASQYSDLLGGLFLLTSITLFLFFQRTKDTGYLKLMGLSLGMMAFTKVEGTALGLLSLLTAVLLIMTGQENKDTRLEAVIKLLVTAVLAMIPIIIFSLFYAPANGEIFINGLTSRDHPVTLERFWFIWRYYGIEFTHPKWNGLWIILLGGILLGMKNSWRRELWIFPIVLGGYFIIFTGSYNINTFYEMVWWVTTSLNRVIFALIPTLTLWAFLAVTRAER
ncbi:MAG: hypothetical protein V2A70_00640 [Candidatus Omnitrophota bacterium]